MKACPVGDQLNVLISLLVTLTASDIFLLGCNSFPLGVDNNFVRLHFFLFFHTKGIFKEQECFIEAAPCVVVFYHPVREARGESEESQ